MCGFKNPQYYHLETIAGGRSDATMSNTAIPHGSDYKTTSSFNSYANSQHLATAGNSIEPKERQAATQACVSKPHAEHVPTHLHMHRSRGRKQGPYLLSAINPPRTRPST